MVSIRATHFTTTCLQFKDRLEGQILHVGSFEECDKVAKAISAVAYTGPEQILEATLSVREIPAEAEWIPETGEYWKWQDGQLYTKSPK